MTVPIIGNTWAIGLAFQLHLVIVALVMGIAILAPIAEIVGLRRHNQHWERLSHELALTIVRLFSFGATWAVLAVVLLFGLYPRLFGVLSSIFYGPMVVIAGLWIVMTLSAYMYYYTWERLAERKSLHVAIGITFAGSAFVFVTIVSALSSFQLTPSDSTQLQPAILNPSWLTEIVHRHVGNLSYAGLILAGYAGLRYILSGNNKASKAYYDWLGHIGFLLGTGLALLQPIGGWFYARQIQMASREAYERMMTKENSWMFLIQTFFFGIVVFLGNTYLVQAIRRGNPGPRTISWLNGSLWAMAVFILLNLVPKEWPLGQMTPWKYIGLAGLVLISLVNLSLYLRARRQFVWGRIGVGSQMTLIVLGMAIIALMVTMGIIRESARGGDLIYKRLGPGTGQQLEIP